MEYLFEVNIGPVQGFIASARRSRDLWFGSWVLSELSKAAARCIADQYTLESLIFPAPQNIEELGTDEKPDTDLSVANKIIAKVFATQDGINELAEKVRVAVFNRLSAIKDTAFKIAWNHMGDSDRKIATAQIEDLVEFSWAGVPLKEADYMYSRHLLEAIVSARKNTRDFAPVTWGDKRPKSSISGQLESVIPKKYYTSRESLNLYKDFHAGSSEHLSGVDLLKRWGATENTPGFPSTSHIASLSYLNRLDQITEKAALEQAKVKWEAYLRAVKGLNGLNERVELEYVPNKYNVHAILGRYEGSMLFAERLVDLVDDVNRPEVKAAMREATQALETFFKHVDVVTESRRRPNPYYAILQADGDSMGVAIDNQGNSEGHQRISRALDSFSSQVSKIVENYQGALIYAGGDDVLAFLPLHTVLECAHKLSEEFCKTLKDFKDKDGNSPTLSVGVVIVHHLSLLSESLELVRKAETAAKKVDGKNALAITMSKRSGDDYTIAGCWSDKDGRDGIYAHLDKLIEFCDKDEIPDGTAYEIREMVQRLTVPAIQKDQLETAEVYKLIAYEVKRIIDRKLRVPRGKLTDARAKEIEGFLHNRLGIQKNGVAASMDRERVENFINELLIAQALADARKLAQVKQGDK